MTKCTTVEKVIVPKVVADSIEELRRKGYNNTSIFNHLRSSSRDSMHITEAQEWVYRKEASDTLMEALVDGYEVEQSPEDKLRDYYDDAWVITPFDDVLAKHKKAGRREGVIRTLRILGVEVEGINKKETIV